MVYKEVTLLTRQPMQSELVEKYFNNQCSVEEAELVLKWFDTDEGQQYLKQRLDDDLAHRELSESDAAFDSEALLARLQQKINKHMPTIANNPKRKSWLSVPENSDFPIQNIPFGVFITKDDVITIGSRIGDHAIDLGALQQLGYFEGIELTDDMFMQDTLNDFISDGKKTWRLVRDRIAEIFDVENPKLRDNASHRAVVVCPVNEVEMQLPVLIGDYTDFYSSKEHATNVGKMFRDPANVSGEAFAHAGKKSFEKAKQELIADHILADDETDAIEQQKHHGEERQERVEGQ